MEVWKDIAEYENIYKVSNLGNVMSFNDKGVRLLKQEVARGYKRVTLSKCNVQKRFLVHRLVCMAFNKNAENKKCVNHIDGNKKNNKSVNLEWCTASENEKHSHIKLGKIPPCAKKCINKKTGKVYNSITKAAIDLNIKPSTLLAKVRGQNINDTCIEII